jgi:hypothetical protein
MDKKDDDVVAKYMAQLNELERKALELAKNHLGTSFNVNKSNGFKDWVNKKT